MADAAVVGVAVVQAVLAFRQGLAAETAVPGAVVLGVIFIVGLRAEADAVSSAVLNLVLAVGVFSRRGR